MKSTRMATVLGGALVLFSQFACEEEKKATPALVEDKPAELPPPAPIPRSAPTLSVDEAGPQVRGMGVQLMQANGAPDVTAIEKLRSYLADEKEFLEGKDLKIEIVRTTKRGHVATFLSELSKFSPSKITIKTSTRGDLPGEIEFIAQEKATSADPCSLVGTITDDRGTAIWRLSGGQALKRQKGMGGPDLSMTGETILNMSKKCESPYFFVTGTKDVDWGLTYDLAASGLSLKDGRLTKAIVLKNDAVAGTKIEL